MPRSIMRFAMPASLLVLAVAAVGCGSSTNPSVPGIEPEVVNVTDSFEYQVLSVESYSGSATYSWENSGTVAAIDHSSAITNGGATLTVRDADGTMVYSGPLSDSGSLVSASGTAGTWTIVLSYATFSGNVNFRVQKG